MRCILLILFVTSSASAVPPQAPPVSVPPQAPPVSEGIVQQIYADAVRNGRFLVWFDERPVLADALLEWRGATGVITVSGPYHGGRHIPYATFQQATFSEVKSAVEASKMWWAAERVAKQTTTREPIGHTHTCPQCGNVWDHQANPGHNCANCGTQQLVQDSRPRPVTVKVTVKPTADPFAKAVEVASALPVGSVEALDEVNAKRAREGLYAFVRDDGLTLAAARAAKQRADRLLFGHLENDFACLPPGVRADAAGCAAYANTGWLSCCMSDTGYTHAGAAYVIGSDGRRFMHLFVRNDGGNSNATSANYSGGSGRLFWRFRR